MEEMTFVIAHNGRHLFDVSRLDERINIKEFTEVLCTKFPKTQGYTIYRDKTVKKQTSQLIQTGVLDPELISFIN